jgi:hypothetical protein
MKRIIPFLLFSFIASFVFAQFENFDLSKYKLPEIKRQQLDFHFNSNGDKLKRFAVISELDTTYKRNELNFNVNSHVNYKMYKNTLGSQITGNFEVGGTYQKTDNSGYQIYTDKEIYQTEFANLTLDWKEFNKNNWFLNFSPDLSGSYMNDNSISQNRKRKSYILNSSVGLGIGKGRIEQVQDFRQAVLIISELKKRDCLAKDISESEMYEFADLISQLKNQRIFDARKRKETDLMALNSFLKEKGLIDKIDISYFTGLEDLWSYGGLQVRESGNQIQFLVTPNYYLYNYAVDLNDATEEKERLNYNLFFVSKKPLSIKWQRDFVVGLQHIFTKNIRNRYNSILPLPNFFNSTAYVNGKVGYYPNTRTYISCSADLSLTNFSYSEIWKDSSNTFTASVSSYGYYYISERLRLEYFFLLSRSLGEIFNKEVPNSKYFTGNYNIAFNYAIF